MEAKRFAVLDGLRGVAALIVITDHVWSQSFTAALPGRYLAVDFFFVLSGFILAHVYGERMKQGLSAWTFMRTRLIRLYPLYMLGTLIGAAAVLLAGIAGPERTGASLLLSAVWSPTPPFILDIQRGLYPLNGPAWSLFFELVVNGAFALAILRLNRGVLVAIMAVSALLLVPVALSLGRVDSGFNWDNILGGFPRVFYGFFAGVLIYQMQWRAPRLPAWAPFLGFLAIVMIPTSAPLRPVYEWVAVVFLMPALVAFGAGAEASGRVRGALLWLGAMSFGVYALHVPLWGMVALGLDSAGLDLPGEAKVILVAIVALAAAALADRLIDAPARRWLARLLRIPAKTPIVATR